VWSEVLHYKLFIAVFLIGVWGTLVHEDIPFQRVSVVAGALSQAMLIAAVLGVTVDRVAKDELLHEVSADVWHNLMARNLPEEIKAFIKAALIDTRVVCTRYELRYRFAERADGRLHVFVETKRELRNFGSRLESLVPSMSIFLDEEPEFLAVTCESTEDSSFSWPEDATVTEQNSQDGALTLHTRKVAFAPHGDTGDTLTLTWKYKIVKSTTDTDISAYGIPSTETAIFVDDAPAWLDIKVDKQPHPIGKIWKVRAVLWAGAFHRVRWFDRRPVQGGQALARGGSATPNAPS
jgi:hypothetical protein